MNRPGLGGVDQRDVCVKACGNVALAVQAVALRRVPAGHTRHVVVAHAAPCAFADEGGQQVLGAAKAALGHPDFAKIVAAVFTTILLGQLHLMPAAGVVAHHPVQLACQQRVP